MVDLDTINAYMARVTETETVVERKCLAQVARHCALHLLFNADGLRRSLDGLYNRLLGLLQTFWLTFLLRFYEGSWLNIGLLRFLVNLLGFIFGLNKLDRDVIIGFAILDRNHFGFRLRFLDWSLLD